MSRELLASLNTKNLVSDDGIRRVDMLCGFFLNMETPHVNTKDAVIEFIKLCMTAETPADISAIVQFMSNDSLFPIKSIYNCLVGWGLPSPIVCSKVKETWNLHVREHLHARLIDFGAGSGVFSFMFAAHGIPHQRIVALELPDDKRSPNRTLERKFFPLTINENFVYKSSDILFIAWGDTFPHEYLEAGGGCVIIVGEESDGCTFPVDYFDKNPNWNISLTKVPSPIRFCTDYISVNVLTRGKETIPESTLFSE